MRGAIYREATLKELTQSDTKQKKPYTQAKVKQGAELLCGDSSKKS